jgi:hypothetical protein
MTLTQMEVVVIRPSFGCVSILNSTMASHLISPLEEEELVMKAEGLQQLQHL